MHGHSADFARGDRIEVLHNDMWRPATVIRAYLYGMYLVQYDGERTGDWAQAVQMRLATTGDSDDT